MRAQAAALVAILAAIALGVVPAARAESRDLFLEAEVEPAEVPVMAQAVYRLRLYQGVDVTDLRIAEPFVPLADFRPIGGERIFEQVREGRRYRVRERLYAVFPYASGELGIPRAEATGRVTSVLGSSADGREPVRVQAPPRALTVFPLPPPARLAAATLGIEEAWTPARPGNAKLGETLRRVIRIEASGVDAGQLPEIDLRLDGVAVHAEPPRLENRFEGTVNRALREQAFRLVPRRPGPMVLPEVRIPWWNTRSGIQEVAVVPARVVEVAGSAPAKAAADIPAPPDGAAPRWLAAAAAAVGLGGLAAWLAWRGRARSAAAWRLRRAGRAGNPREVCDALLAWSATLWPEAPPRSIDALARRLEDPVARERLYELERAAYGPTAGAAGNVSWRRVIQLVRREARRNRGKMNFPRR